MNRALTLLLCGLTGGAFAQSVSQVDPHVHASVSTSPAGIHLQWVPPSGAQSYSISRRAPGGTWQSIATSLDAGTASFDDSNVQLGQLYEYDVAMSSTIGQGNGYLMAGIEVPFPDNPRRVLVVIDQSMEAALATELTQLEADLAAEGWEFQRIAVAPDAGPPEVHAQLRAAYDLAPSQTTAALLLGGVPRAFSGALNPDGHGNHYGAWPADGYYADMADAGWTDLIDYGANGNIRDNRIGDGQFDQTTFPNALALAVGRVDTVDMPAFTGLDATALLARYLHHDHAFRSGTVRIPSRGFVSDFFSYFGGEAFARVGFRDTTAIFGTEADTAGGFFDALEADGGYAYAVGCGGGNPTGAGGIGSTSDFVARHPNAVYIGLFGSYFGDWSFTNDFLRASLLSPGVTLATTWFARPYSHFHALGALQTFGEAFLATVKNYNNDYDQDFGGGYVSQGLLGDPTLRMFVTLPPTQLVASSPPGAGVNLSWQASADPVVGYHVYRRASSSSAAPVRLTTSPVTTVQYSDPSAVVGQAYDYRVVAVQHLTTGSGTFFNHSPGVFAQATAVAGSSGGDGGTLADGGQPDGGNIAGVRNVTGGCGCDQSGSGGIMWLFPLAFVPALRARARRFARGA